MTLVFVVALMVHAGMHTWHFAHSLQSHQCELLSSDRKFNFYNCSLDTGADVWLKIKEKQNMKSYTKYKL